MSLEEEIEGIYPSRVEYVGPFEHHDVVVNGWTVPFLEACPIAGGMVSLTLDRRFGLDLPIADAERIVPFIADCIAVACGYTAHPGDGLDEPLRSDPMHRTHSITMESAPGGDTA